MLIMGIKNKLYTFVLLINQYATKIKNFNHSKFNVKLNC